MGKKLALSHHSHRDPESVFPSRRDSYDDDYMSSYINERDIPIIARRVVEEIHHQRPDAVIAADRGGRILAFATHYSWSKRYPDEPFPTVDKKLHIARISKSAMTKEDAILSARDAFKRAGVASYEKESEEILAPKHPRVMLLDDWIYQGATFHLFKEAAELEGISARDISVATMCGSRKKVVSNRHSRRPTHVRHFSPLEYRSQGGSKWSDDSSSAGVHYKYDEPFIPEVIRDGKARGIRREIIAEIDRYYKEYETQLALGKIVACNCVYK